MGLLLRFYINEDWSLLLVCAETLIIIIESLVIFRLLKSRTQLPSHDSRPHQETHIPYVADITPATPAIPIPDPPTPIDKTEPTPIESPEPIHAETTESIPTDSRESDDTPGCSDTHRRRTVLLVEKDPALQAVYYKILEQQYVAKAVSELTDAIPLAVSGVVDCLVVSHSSPVGNQDYRESIRRIKDSDPMENVKIIFLTLNSSDIQTAKYYQDGIDLILHKPVTPTELCERIEYLYGDLPISGLPPYRHLAGKSYSNEERRFLNQLTDLLENDHENDTNGIGLIAQRLALSHSSLYKRLKTLTGLSVIEFSSAMKICKALRLMENGKDNVNVISAESGFREVKSFRNTFKSIMGMPPSAYIKQLSNAATEKTPDSNGGNNE